MAAKVTLLVILVASLLLIPVLVFIIRGQLRQLREQRAAQQAQRTERETSQRYIRASIEILARSILADQVEYSEACIRIKVLLDAVDPHLSSEPSLAVFDQLYVSLAHHPTHEARDLLSRTQRQQLDEQRWSLENDHREAIREAAAALLRHPVLN